MLPVLLQILAENLPVFDTKYRFLTKILPVFGSGGLAGMQISEMGGGNLMKHSHIV